MKIDIKVKEKVINGLRVVHIKNTGSLMSYVGFHCLSGSFAEGRKNQGVSHYLEHMFFKGTKKRNYEDIVDEAALMGAKQNAYTSEFDTCYFLTTPSVNYSKAIELLCDQMFNSTFPQEEMDKERTVIQAERKSYDDSPMHDFYAKLEKSLINFQLGHPVIGTEKTIDSLNRDDLIDYYKTNYGNNNVVLVVSAPFKSKKVFKQCEKYLESNTFGEAKVTKVKDKLIKNYIDTNVSRHGIQQTHMALLFESVPLNYDESAEHGCMINAIGGGMSSLLFKRIREELGLCYSISASPLVKTLDGGLSFIHTLLDESSVLVAKEEIISVIEKVANSGFDDKTFKCSKAKMLSKLCQVVSDPDNLSSPLAKSKLWDYDFDIQKHYDNIENLTLESLNEYAKKYLTETFFGEKKKSCWFTMNPEE
jgi:predicted Zn-dependent peptidase